VNFPFFARSIGSIWRAVNRRFREWANPAVKRVANTSKGLLLPLCFIPTQRITPGCQSLDGRGGGGSVGVGVIGLEARFDDVAAATGVAAELARSYY
jgi:hypothetical protein